MLCLTSRCRQSNLEWAGKLRGGASTCVPFDTNPSFITPRGFALKQGRLCPSVMARKYFVLTFSDIFVMVTHQVLAIGDRLDWNWGGESNKVITLVAQPCITSNTSYLTRFCIIGIWTNRHTYIMSKKLFMYILQTYNSWCRGPYMSSLDMFYFRTDRGNGLVDS